MKSAIQTLTDGLVYCENYLKDNPNCSGQTKSIKQQQIVEHEKAINILTSNHSNSSIDVSVLLDFADFLRGRELKFDTDSWLVKMFLIERSNK